jgi:hypothetical protein
MARQTLDDNFFEIPITSGTIQNTGLAPIEINNTQTDNTGIILEANEIYSWDNETIYARKASDTSVMGEVCYVPFKKATGGGGGSYTLPVASASTLGGIKVGSGLSIDSDGVLTGASTYTLPTATASVLGGVRSSLDTGNVKVNADGTMTVNGGGANVINLDETLLYSGNDLVVADPSNRASYTLSDNYNNYDYIILEIVAPSAVSSAVNYCTITVKMPLDSTLHHPIFSMSIYNPAVDTKYDYNGFVEFNNDNIIQFAPRFQGRDLQGVILSKVIGFKLNTLSPADMAEMAMPSSVYVTISDNTAPANGYLGNVAYRKGATTPTNGDFYYTVGDAKELGLI